MAMDSRAKQMNAIGDGWDYETKDIPTREMRM
jgi:hypothetical protein